MLDDPSNIAVATLNVNGLPTFYHVNNVPEVLLAYPSRHKQICHWFEWSKVDVINFQEVFTYRNLYLLKRNLPSYPYMAFKPYIFGPRGALVTFSRLPIKTRGFQSFYAASRQAIGRDLPRLSLLKSALKGILVSQLVSSQQTIINTHLLANVFLDWRPGSRYYGVQQAQLNALSKVVRQYSTGKVLVVGDLNVTCGSQLMGDFLAGSGLKDIFANDTATSFHNAFMPPGYDFGQRIDFILSNQPAVTDHERIFTQRFKIDGSGEVFLSDHQGLRATMPV